MKALIISGGSINDVEFYKRNLDLENYDLVICADRGIEYAENLGIQPHVIIGDFDSVNPNIFEKVKKNKVNIITLPVEKDSTDTQAALEYLIEKNYNNITMIACIGSRIDHTLANIYLLKKLLDKEITGTIIDEKNYIYLINSKTKIRGKKGKTLSLLPFSDKVEGINLKGFYYPLTEATMTKEDPYGVSNIITEDIAEVTVRSGELLVIISED